MKETQRSKGGGALRHKILSDHEVRLMARRLQEVMGQPFVELFDRYGLNVEDDLRFMSVAARVQEARERKGLDLKKAAAAVKVPQYRLRDIEQGRPKHLVPSILVKYVDFLGLKVWFGRWKNANPGIVARLEL